MVLQLLTVILGGDLMSIHVQVRLVPVLRIISCCTLRLCGCSPNQDVFQYIALLVINFEGVF